MSIMAGNNEKQPQVLRQGNDWRKLRLYHKSDALYQLTVEFCHRFLPKYGDRTVDQMIQAARSGKQNIVEGTEDGKASTEMELKLLTVDRGSIQELRQDFLDFANTHKLPLWKAGHPRFQPMQDFTKSHNNPEDYMPLSKKWNAEEYCNICLTLCYQLDAMLNSYIKKQEEIFVKEGGIKERMYAARTGYRKGIDDKMKQLESENAALKAKLDEMTSVAASWKSKYMDLRQRAVKAYNDLKRQLDELRDRRDRYDKQDR